MSLILKWSWVHGSREVEQFDSIEEAILAAKACSDQGSESFSCIEVVEDDGTATTYDRNHLPLWHELEQREDDAWKRRPLPVAVVSVLDPDGEKSATYSGYLTRGQADQDAEWLRAFLGDRVSVRDLRPAAHA